MAKSIAGAARPADGPNYKYMKKSGRRAMIIARARGVFAQKGYNGATVGDICKACGIAQGTLYVHFGNKREVFRAVMYDTVDRIQDMMAPGLPEGAWAPGSEGFSIGGYIKLKILHILETVKNDLGIFLILLRESGGFGDEMDELISRVNRIMLGQAQAEIALGQAMGLLRSVDPKAAARMAIGTVLMYIITHFIEGGAPELESLAEEISDLILKGLAAAA